MGKGASSQAEKAEGVKSQAHLKKPKTFSKKQTKKLLPQKGEGGFKQSEEDGRGKIPNLYPTT